jgi:hypothetical protein
MSTHGVVTRYGKQYHAWKVDDISGEVWWVDPTTLHSGFIGSRRASERIAATYEEIESDSMMVAIADEIALIMFPDEPRSAEESDQYWVHSVLWTSDLPGMDWPKIASCAD